MTKRKLLAPLIVCALLQLGLSLPGCSQDAVEIPDELRGDPYCALIIGSYGHYEDGDRWLIADYDTGFVAGGCVCGFEEDIYSGARDEELNEAALEECEFQASTMDFEWNECREDFESGEWLTLVVAAEDDYPWLVPAGPDRCAGY